MLSLSLGACVSHQPPRAEGDLRKVSPEDIQQATNAVRSLMIKYGYQTTEGYGHKIYLIQVINHNHARILFTQHYGFDPRVHSQIFGVAKRKNGTWSAVLTNDWNR
jgi:hypothetical protein